MKPETVAVVRERERELQFSEISFINDARKLKRIGEDIKDGLLCKQVRKKLVILHDSLSFL